MRPILQFYTQLILRNQQREPHRVLEYRGSCPRKGYVSPLLHNPCPCDSFTQRSGPEGMAGFAIPDPGRCSHPVYPKDPSPAMTAPTVSTLESLFTSQKTSPFCLPCLPSPNKYPIFCWENEWGKGMRKG